MASQDAVFRPLAKTLVDAFRVSSLNFVRITNAYDPATGTVVPTEVVFPGAGALLMTSNTEAGGVAGPQEIECWFDLEGIGDIWPTTNDAIDYDGYRWKVVVINPKYSGDVKYAAKITARYQ